MRRRARFDEQVRPVVVLVRVAEVLGEAEHLNHPAELDLGAVGLEHRDLGEGPAAAQRDAESHDGQDEQRGALHHGDFLVCRVAVNLTVIRLAVLIVPSIIVGGLI